MQTAKNVTKLPGLQSWPLSTQGDLYCKIFLPILQNLGKSAYAPANVQKGDNVLQFAAGKIMGRLGGWRVFANYMWVPGSGKLWWEEETKGWTLGEFSLWPT